MIAYVRLGNYSASHLKGSAYLGKVRDKFPILRHVGDCLIMVRDRGDFFSSLGMVAANGQVHNLAKGDNYIREGIRPKIALLYTDEDIHIASYVRTHFDTLDKASGSQCDVLFIENPASVDAFRFWRSVLEKNLYVAWKLLGWADSIPYQKAQAYDIADRLGIRFDLLPCAAILNPNYQSVDEIIELGEDLTSTFRSLFSRFQSIDCKMSQSVPGKASLPSLPRPICFLSHSSSNKHLVREVATILHSYGIETWFDEWEILPGDRITKKIEEGLSGATAVIIFVSQQALNSPWVDEEIHNALHQAISSKKYQIIPVLIDRCAVPISLANYKRIEVGSNALKISDEIKRALLRITN